MTLNNDIFSKTASEAVNRLAVMYAEAQKSKMNKQADLLTNSALGALAGAGIGGLGTLGYDYLKGKKLNLRNALYGGLIGAVPGAAIGGLMTEGAPDKKDDKGAGGNGTAADRVKALSEEKPKGLVDTAANEASLALNGVMAAPGTAALSAPVGYYTGKRVAGGLLDFKHPEAARLESEIRSINDAVRPTGPGVEPTRMRTVADPGVAPTIPLKSTGTPYLPNTPAYRKYLKDTAIFNKNLADFQAFQANQAAHQSWKQKNYDYIEALKNLNNTQGKLPGLRSDLDRILAAKGTAGQTLHGKPGGLTRSSVGGIPGALLAVLASGPMSNWMNNYYKQED